MNYLYGFCSAASVYYALNRLSPAKETLLDHPIYEDIIVQDGVPIFNDGVQLSSELKTEKHVAMTSVTHLPSP